MAYVITAFWKAKPGEEQRIEQIIQTMTPLTLDEPGCIAYQGHRSLEEPGLFMLYEQYVDEAALDAHRASAHFQRYVIGEAIPNLESRSFKPYETIDR
jgi:(4S)-4-hydroxy-5-phosphonooxypentane-2,3-dione isomerase